MPLVDQPFAETFDFARDREGVYRDAAGALVTAAVDAPRFDYGPDGRPLGLLIEGRPEFGQADRVEVVAGDWAVLKGTVLHAYRDDAGVDQRRAWYSSTDPVATVNGCLNLKGHAGAIAYVPTYLPNRGGYVLWRGEMWELGGIVTAEDGVAIGLTSTIMMLEG